MTVKIIGGQQQTGDTLLSMFNNKSKDLSYTKEQQAMFATTQVDTDDQYRHTERYIHQSLLYLNLKGTEEVKAFKKTKQIQKMGHEVEGV